MALPFGIYDALLNEGLQKTLKRHPELVSVLGKIDQEEQPSSYAAFLGRVIEQALKQEDPNTRLALCNQLIDILSGNSERAHIGTYKLVRAEKSIHLEGESNIKIGNRL